MAAEASELAGLLAGGAVCRSINCGCICSIIWLDCDVFPNAACVVSLVDRLVHNSEIVVIDGDSYRAKEARERAEQRARKRRKTKS